jgi:hypothetical protein
MGEGLRGLMRGAGSSAAQRLPGEGFQHRPAFGGRGAAPQAMRFRIQPAASAQLRDYGGAAFTSLSCLAIVRLKHASVSCRWISNWTMSSIGLLNFDSPREQFLHGRFDILIFVGVALEYAALQARRVHHLSDFVAVFIYEVG